MVASTDINKLIRIGESLTLEYKSSFDRESIETLVAFANAKGGGNIKNSNHNYR